VRVDGQVAAARQTVLSDAQTSGGLLIATAEADTRGLLDQLLELDIQAAEIGELLAGEPGAIVLR
jgi:selenophosphate synthase